MDHQRSRRQPQQQQHQNYRQSQQQKQQRRKNKYDYAPEPYYKPYQRKRNMQQQLDDLQQQVQQQQQTQQPQNPVQEKDDRPLVVSKAAPEADYYIKADDFFKMFKKNGSLYQIMEPELLKQHLQLFDAAVAAKKGLKKPEENET